MPGSLSLLPALGLGCLMLGFWGGWQWADHRRSQQTDAQTAEAQDDTENLPLLSERERHQLLHNVLAFYDTRAAEVMTRRPEMVAFAQQTPLQQALPRMLDSGYSRFPVYAESIDSIQGLVHLKELFRAGQQQHDLTLADFVRPTLFVPKDKAVLSLLEQMQAQRIRLVIVADEYGGTEGLLTLNDLVYEVFGDWAETPVSPIEALDNQRFRVQGQTDLYTLQQVLQLTLPSGPYQTLAGFVLQRLGYIPQSGERVNHAGWVMEVSQMNGPRIVSLELQRDPQRGNTRPLRLSPDDSS